jgi:glycosyl transferase family 87
MWKYLVNSAFASTWMIVLRRRSYGARWAPLAIVALGGLTIAALLLISRGTWFGDFDKAYYPAGASILHNPRVIYECDPAVVACFVNVPIIAVVFAPLGALPLPVAHGIMLAAGLPCIAAIIVLLVLACHARGPSRLAIAALVLLNGPLYYTVRLGNTSHFVLAIVLTGFLLMEARRPYLAGACIAVASLVKPPLLLLGGYLVLRGRWKESAGFACAVAVLLGASISAFGIDLHRDWFDRVHVWGCRTFSSV